MIELYQSVPRFGHVDRRRRLEYVCALHALASSPGSRLVATQFRPFGIQNVVLLYERVVEREIAKDGVLLVAVGFSEDTTSMQVDQRLQCYIATMATGYPHTLRIGAFSIEICLSEL